ncbi:MAG TPA: PIN domain-containing protein [Longimicrobiaceae bacterium]
MARNSSYYVVFDANILISDFWMSGPGFSYLLTHQFLGHRPVIPEVAFLEARNQLKQRAESLLSKRSADGDGSQGNTMRLLRLFNYKRLTPRVRWDVEKLLKRWERHVNGILRQFDGKVLPSPPLDVSDLVQRSIARRKPFSKGDRGFRDTIIWLSTLDLVGPDSLVSFVTSNVQDFFEPNSAEPHSEILAEAEERLKGDWKMLFHRSVDEFIARFDADRATSSEALQRAFISNSFAGFDLWQWLEENLVEVVGDEEFDFIAWAGVSNDAEAPVLRNVSELISLDISRVNHLRDDTYRMYCDISFVGEFTCDVLFSKAETVVHVNQILWKNETHPFWTFIGMRAAATFILRIDFDVRTRSVVAAIGKPLVHWRSFDEEIADLEGFYEEAASLEGGAHESSNEDDIGK